MSLRSFFAGLFGPSQSLGGGWLWNGMHSRTDAGVDVSEYTALNVPGVYAAVSRIADTIGMLPFAVYKASPNGDTQIQPMHRVHRLVNHRPNPYMSAYCWKQTTQAHALLWGNGYTEVELNGAGESIALWPLLPDRTMVKRVDADVLIRTNIDGKNYDLPTSQVSHVRALGHDGYVGYSPIALARQAVGMAVATERYGAKLFSNDAKSGGFIQHPLPLSPQAAKNLSESVNAKGGLDNAHRIKVLEEGAKFVSTSIPPDDAQFLGTRSFQLAEFARLYNVPLIMLQALEGSTVWGTGIEQLMIGFVSWTIQPWLTQWELELNEKLFTEAEREHGYYIKGNVNALLRGDMAGRAAFYSSMFGVGALSPNEIRELEERNQIEGLSEHFRPANYVPVTAPATVMPTPTPSTQQKPEPEPAVPEPESVE